MGFWCYRPAQQQQARTLWDIFREDVRLPNVPVDNIMTVLGAEGLDLVSGAVPSSTTPPRPERPKPMTMSRTSEEVGVGC